MIAIKVTKQEWKDNNPNAYLLGQAGQDVIIEVEVGDAYTGKFEQRCLPGKYGEKRTYAEIVNIRRLIVKHGDLDSYEALLEAEIVATQLALVEIYEGGL